MLSMLVDMGYLAEEALMAMDKCGVYAVQHHPHNYLTHYLFYIFVPIVICFFICFYSIRWMLCALIMTWGFEDSCSAYVLVF
jgi:hypothetical protein